MESSEASEAQRCSACVYPAAKSLILSTGDEYVPVCPNHEAYARELLVKQGVSVVDVKLVGGRNLEAKSYPFGQRVYGSRLASLVQEVDAEPPITVSKRMQDKESANKARQAGSFLQALGTDWKQLRVRKIHDHRLTAMVDGQQFTVYTRKG